MSGTLVPHVPGQHVPLRPEGSIQAPSGAGQDTFYIGVSRCPAPRGNRGALEISPRNFFALPAHQGDPLNTRKGEGGFTLAGPDTRSSLVIESM